MRGEKWEFRSGERPSVYRSLCELLKVKSIVTLAIVGTMAFMAVREMIEPATFMTVAGSVVTYYFTKRDGSVGINEGEKND